MHQIYNEEGFIRKTFPVPSEYDLRDLGSLIQFETKNTNLCQPEKNTEDPDIIKQIRKEEYFYFKKRNY